MKVTHYVLSVVDEVSHQNECHNEYDMGSKHDEQTQNTNGAQGVAQLDLVAATVEQGHNPNGVDQLDKFTQNDIQTDAEAESMLFSTSKLH